MKPRFAPKAKTNKPIVDFVCLSMSRKGNKYVFRFLQIQFNIAISLSPALPAIVLCFAAYRNSVILSMYPFQGCKILLYNPNDMTQIRVIKSISCASSGTTAENFNK